MTTPIAFAALGAALAELMVQVDRRAQVNRARRSLIATRAAIAEESAILNTLDADSVSAAALRALIEGRTSRYLGLTPVRPRIGGSSAFAILFGLGATAMFLNLARTTSSSERALSAGVGGFCATAALLVAASIIQVLRRYRLACTQSSSAPPEPVDTA